jgi:hypothetical protein
MHEELERCLAAARACADACEAHLDELPDRSPELREAVDLLAAPAAVARTLEDLVDQPLQLTLAAARLLGDLAAHAAERVDGAPELEDALRAVADSTERLLAAAG